MKRLPFFLGLIAGAGLFLSGCADPNGSAAGSLGTGAPASSGVLGGTGSGTGGTGIGNGTGGR